MIMTKLKIKQNDLIRRIRADPREYKIKPIECTTKFIFKPHHCIKFKFKLLLPNRKDL